MENKKLLKIFLSIFLIIAIVLVVVGVVMWIQKNQSINRENQFPSLQTEKKGEIQKITGWEKLEVKNFSVEKQENGTYFNATIYNNSQEATESGDISVKIMDKDGNIILNSGLVIDSIPAGEEVGIQINTDQELIGADHCVVEKK